jgi:hypothetical protein
MFPEEDYWDMHSIVFRDDYPGYKPDVIEIPHGDGKADAKKRYAHIATKYFTGLWHEKYLAPYLEKAHLLACKAALLANVPAAFMPELAYGALRILDYPPGAESNRHEDFDLFTLLLYRDQPDKFCSEEVSSPALDAIRTMNAQAHLGQLGTAIGLGPATTHWVIPSDEAQHSIVYFSIPNHDAILPDGTTVRDWLNERMARSRTAFKNY